VASGHLKKCLVKISIYVMVSDMVKEDLFLEFVSIKLFQKSVCENAIFHEITSIRIVYLKNRNEWKIVWF
jgi:hypothetical protein